MKWILPRTHIYLMKNENVSTKVFVFNLSLEFFPFAQAGIIEGSAIMGLIGTLR